MILEDNFGVIALGIRPPDFLYIRQDDVIQLMESIKSEKKIIRSWVRKRREPPLLFLLIKHDLTGARVAEDYFIIHKKH